MDLRLELPSGLVAASDSPEDLAWLAGLPRLVHELTSRWSLTLDPPFQPGGETAWVAPARDADGRDLVLKVGRRHTEGEHEVEGLRAWGGRGAVAVHGSWADGATVALLLERARPGTPLRDLRPPPEQDEIVAAALRSLWRPAGAPFRPLAQVCDLWADEVEPLLTPDVLDPGLARDGLALYRALPREDVGPVLLVTDMHAGNLLAAADGTWRLIDPKPYLGDPCFDVLQHVLNDRRVADEPHGMADRMAGLTGLDAARVRTWLFARCVVESAWSEWVRPVAAALAP